MKLDKNGIKQLEAEIKRREQERVRILAKVGEESKLGTKENSAYDNAKQNLDMLNKDITDLRFALDRVQVVKPHGKVDRIDIGDTVTVYNPDIDDRFDVILSANYDVDVDTDEASINSPLGEALYGKKKGDQVTYSADRRQFTVNIEEVVKSKEHSLN